MRKLVASLSLAAAISAIAAVGVVALLTATATPAEAGPCICPKIYAPVRCENGKTYANPCLADCRRAKNCVPTGDL